MSCYYTKISTAPIALLLRQHELITGKTYLALIKLKGKERYITTKAVMARLGIKFYEYETPGFFDFEIRSKQPPTSPATSCKSIW